MLVSEVMDGRAENHAMDVLAIFRVESAAELALANHDSGALVWKRGARRGAILIDAATEDVLRGLGASDNQ